MFSVRPVGRNSEDILLREKLKLGEILNRTNLMKLFQLEDNQEIFDLALTPKSCGGGDEFKLLALYGDKIIDLALIIDFSNQGFTNTGVISPAIDSFHNEDALNALGRYLEIDHLMNPLDKSKPISDGDVKEGVEALIGAAYQKHGLTTCIKIVQRLYEQSESFSTKPGEEKATILTENLVGMLQEWLASQGLGIPVYEGIRVGGTNDNPLWRCQVSFEYHGEKVKEKSDIFSNKRLAKKNAAQKALVALGIRKDNVSRVFGSIQEVKIPETATQSLQEREILFTKGGRGGHFITGEIQLTTQTGETVLEWAEKKIKKNPYGSLILLSARLEEISGSSWSTSLEDQELILLNIVIEDMPYFEIGKGKSKTKARKDAAQKIIRSSNLIKWIAQKYSTILI